MSDLAFARGQMTVSLMFHIFFAVAGMAMPLLMLVAGIRHHRTGDPVYRALGQRWAKGTAILFAVGAVSGTVLSFELGLLWPHFMAFAGPMVGLPFSLEGFAFFLEAIFLGLFLYGWERLSPRLHLFSAAMVAASGLASGIFVMAVNAWMQGPTGFTLDAAGQPVDIDPYGPFFAPAFPSQALHMALAAYSSVAFAVLGIHAWRLLREPESRFHQHAAQLAFFLAAVSTPLQLVSGDLSAKHIAAHQPVKLAAAESLFHTTRAAPLAIGGWPDTEAGALRYAIEVPYALSVLAFADPQAEVKGLDQVPREDWPNVPLVHLSFQVMVGCGTAMLLLVAWGAWGWWRTRTVWWSQRFLRAAVLASPLGLIAVQTGWIVTEVGRQPWIIQGVMRVEDAVTPMPGLVAPFVLFTALYLVLGVVVVVLLKAHVFAAPRNTEVSP
jgi:cytochrome d ubiquinol oxidase subunit I